MEFVLENGPAETELKYLPKKFKFPLVRDLKK